MKKAGHESFVFLPGGAKLSRYCRLLNYPSLLSIDIRFGTPSTAYQSIPNSTDPPAPVCHLADLESSNSRHLSLYRSHRNNSACQLTDRLVATAIH